MDQTEDSLRNSQKTKHRNYEWNSSNSSWLLGVAVEQLYGREKCNHSSRKDLKCLQSDFERIGQLSDSVYLLFFLFFSGFLIARIGVSSRSTAGERIAISMVVSLSDLRIAFNEYQKNGLISPESCFQLCYKLGVHPLSSTHFKFQFKAWLGITLSDILVPRFMVFLVRLQYPFFIPC
jgi:hypothetical protein